MVYVLCGSKLRSKDMTNGELLTREIFATHTNVTAIAVNTAENSNNINRFFNDTPWDLDLVALRIGSLGNRVANLADVARQENILYIAEVSRQAQIAQQEGVIASARSMWNEWAGTAALGGKANAGGSVGEHYVGDFKTTIMTLEIETNIFLHSQIFNLLDSVNTIAIGEANHFLGATLYFKLGKLRKR